MADIKDQLIKNSYNYVLQSDLSTGVVYRIGGTVPVNPIFLSGLTVNSSLTYSNGTEQPGYFLTTDGSGYSLYLRKNLNGYNFMIDSNERLTIRDGKLNGMTWGSLFSKINYVSMTNPNDLLSNEDDIFQSLLDKSTGINYMTY